MKKQQYIVEIEMPDGDFISVGWLKDLIQTDCDSEDENRQKVTVQETSLPSSLDETAEEYANETTKMMINVFENVGSVYIPKDKLIAEIERLKARAEAERILHPKTILAAKDYLLIKDYDSLLSFIDSLQQEQPYKSFCEENCKGYRDTGGKCFFGFNCSAKKEHEQPCLPGIEESGIPGKDYIPIEWVDACEKYGKWKIIQQKQSEVDIEKEVDRFLKSEESTTYENAGSYKVAVKDPKKIARHFAKWGAEHLKK